MKGKQPLQAFRSRSITDQVTNIPTQVDTKTGERIVLWRDVKLVFKNAESIRTGNSLVPFLTDEISFELCTPWRIAYHPDEVLEVVMEEIGQVSHSRETSSHIETLALGGGSKDQDEGYHFQSSACTTNVNSLTRTVEDFEIAEIQADTNKNEEFQGLVVQMLDKILRTQQQTNDRLAIIENSIQALATQTYELHEYPIPRLFIVLPMAVGLSGKIKGILSEQFRLYFLCECGTHTMTEDTKTPPHHIHLAKHEGYDLEKPSVFFERYGKYILTVMQMIKYGVAAAGVIVPSLASSGIVDGLDTAQKHMEYIKKNIGSLVDDSIKFLDDVKTNNEMGDELADGHTGFEQLEALEGADLRQLESYLKVKDQGRVLGNLFRIVTSEGHVKWVCFDHYRASYQEKAMKHLREVVEVNRGKYIEEMGRIKIKIASSILARQFYDAMTKARWIQELEITLEWDATMGDLQTLANAVTKANVIRLTVDGSYLKSPALDVINRTRRYDPIMQLASNHRIQSLQLQGFENFFNRVSKSSLVRAPKLRVLSLSSEVPLQDKFKSLSNLLEHYSGLTTLEVKLQQGASIMEVTSDVFNKLPHLESLKIDDGELNVAAGISNSMQGAKDQLSGVLPHHISMFSQLRIGQQGGRCLAIATKGLELHELVELATWDSSKKQVKLQQGASIMEATLDVFNKLPHLESLMIAHGELNLAAGISNSLQGAKDQLSGILGQHISMFSHLRIVQQGGRCLAIAATKGLRLQELVGLATLDTSKKPESFSMEQGKHSVTADVSQGNIQDMILAAEWLGGLDSGGRRFFQNCRSVLAIRYTIQEADEGKLIDMLCHNPLLNHLQIGCKGSRFQTIINLVVSTRERIVQERGSCSLRTFELMEGNLTPFDVLADCDNYNTHMQSHVTFPEGSDSFDMRTWIRLKHSMSIKIEDPVYDFVRQYGWSIVFFDEEYTRNNTFAAILDDIPNTRTSQLESLWIRGAADSELNRLNEIIERSPNFKDLGLNVNLGYKDQFKMVRSCLLQHGMVLSKLHLYGDSSERWSWIASTFPTRNSFPSLVSLEIFPFAVHNLPSNFLSWIMAMVSTPPRGLESHSPTQSLPQNVVDERSIHQESKSTGSWTPLRKILLCRTKLQAEEWKALIEAIDFSALECLNFRWTNFSQVQFKLLMNHIPGDNLSKVRLRTLNIARTDLVRETDSQALKAMFAELRMKAPLVDIITED